MFLAREEPYEDVIGGPIEIKNEDLKVQKIKEIQDDFPDDDSLYDIPMNEEQTVRKSINQTKL